jgi:hypothetical protein
MTPFWRVLVNSECTIIDRTAVHLLKHPLKKGMHWLVPQVLIDISNNYQATPSQKFFVMVG